MLLAAAWAVVTNLAQIRWQTLQLEHQAKQLYADDFANIA
jgi:hypothetical protein